MNRLGDYAIGYQGSDDPFENYIDEYPIATKREIWKQAHREGWEQAKRECAFIVQNYEHNPDRDGDWADQLDEVIATMEYKHGN